MGRGRRVTHKYFSTPEACKGRGRAFSALALRSDLGQSTISTRHGLGAARPLATPRSAARIFTILTQMAIRVCASGP